ncbi:class I SAM-dependent methyltransferase [Cylindrospermum sp. FACHB-282]|uniref:class I SAM-dependent methyltransferase n=1 Tax=Cylindrospermum sp. FACHB-282 TaxID=2692794 RepID=UPI00168448E0|nr:class I SAM-dependent methyltransferase [Cylindrospermum sp. FACHB-282]MBD2384841.1 class I SAM-dependent methyltransferase [Cylindrospermum sp. FACHB-282]
MPSIEENLDIWSNYSWNEQGNEWSRAWGGADYSFWGSIYPRIQAFIPGKTILEIAPGFGRWTQYLKDFCENLTIVDLTDKCIAACQQRFADCSHINYHVNDGKSLKMVPDESIDFVFSFDSLVHAEEDVIKAYLQEIALKLKPNGIGFIHHSNMGSYLNPSTGNLEVENPQLRGETMSAKVFEQYCEQAGLQCLSQEIISWCNGNILCDCLSVFTPKASQWSRPNRVIKNIFFMEEADRLLMNYSLYSLNPQADKLATSQLMQWQQSQLQRQQTTTELENLKYQLQQTQLELELSHATVNELQEVILKFDSEAKF